MRRSMILSDREIREAMENGDLEISGYPELYIGPSSLDMHLDNKAMILDKNKMVSMQLDGGDAIIDVSDPKKSKDLFTADDGWESIILYPGEFYILSTIERIRFGDNIVGFIQGRSSIARIGINVHNAGYFDAGFDGTATLEVTNLTKYPIRLPKNTRICQMVFARTGKPAEVPYSKKKDQKYQGQSGPTITSLHREFDGDERTYQLKDQ